MGKSTTEAGTVIILTDSLNLVTRLKCGQVKEPWVETIRNIANYPTTYILGNRSVWYNETADQLAGIAEPIGQIQLHPDDVRNRMNEAARANPLYIGADPN